MDKPVYLYTDGACKGNPGAGGWGVFMRYGTHEKELFGGEAETTNNRMELTAVIEGLKSLKTPLPSRHLHRLAICQKRHGKLDTRLEKKRLENRRQKTG